MSTQLRLVLFILNIIVLIQLIIQVKEKITTSIYFHLASVAFCIVDCINFPTAIRIIYKNTWSSTT